MRHVVSIRTLFATKFKKQTEKRTCAETVNPYTIYGTIEPEALIVSQIVYGLHLRFWRGLYDFWSRFGESVHYMRNIKRAPPKSKMQSVHCTRQNKDFLLIIHL